MNWHSLDWMVGVSNVSAAPQAIGRFAWSRQGRNAGEQTISNFLTHVFYFSLPLSVNNAGQGLISVFECIPIETAQNLFDTNFFGVMRVLKAVLPGMKARQKGRIINVSSIIGVNGHPFSEIYSASKFALEGLTESLAPTLRKFNIRWDKWSKKQILDSEQGLLNEDTHKTVSRSFHARFLYQTIAAQTGGGDWSCSYNTHPRWVGVKALQFSIRAFIYSMVTSLDFW